MASDSNRMPSLERQLRSLRRVAMAVARPGGPALHADLVRELAEALGAALVFVAVFEDDTHGTLRTLAAQLDGRPLQPFTCFLQGFKHDRVILFLTTVGHILLFQVRAGV